MTNTIVLNTLIYREFQQSRFGFASELLTVNKANLEAASSRITDVDVAEESTQLARWNILVQSGTAMLASVRTGGRPG